MQPSLWLSIVITVTQEVMVEFQFGDIRAVE